jgi:hypothetical protein
VVVGEPGDPVVDATPEGLGDFEQAIVSAPTRIVTILCNLLVTWRPLPRPERVEVDVDGE